MTKPFTGRPALLIHECQRGVLDPELSMFTALVKHAEERDVVANIAELARAFRNAGFPVIHAPIGHRPDFADVLPNTLITALATKHRSMVAGSEEAAFVDALAPEPGDFVVDRTSGNIAMLSSSVDAIMRRMRISTLVLAGVSTNLGIAGCAIAASEMGYAVWVPEDCVAGSDPATHATILQEQIRMIARVVSKREILDVLETTAKAA